MARNNERFRNEGCCARAVSDTRKRGRKRGQQPPFPLASFSLSRAGVSDSRSVGLDAVRRDANAYPPNIDSLARGTHASQRVLYRGRLSPPTLSHRPLVLGLPRIGFPPRHSASLLGTRSRRVFSRIFSFSNLKGDLNSNPRKLLEKGNK